MRTDHDGLKHILYLVNSTSRLAQCCLLLSESDVEVVHCAGIGNQDEDTLLRVTTNDKNLGPLKDIPLLVKDTCNGKDTSTNDDTVALSQSLQPLTVAEFLRSYVSNINWSNGHFQDGHTNFEFNFGADSLLLWRSRVDVALQIEIPQSLRHRIFKLSHHLSIADTSCNDACTIRWVERLSGFTWLPMQNAFSANAKSAHEIVQYTAISANATSMQQLHPFGLFQRISLDHF